MSIVGGRACYSLHGKQCQILTFLEAFTAGTLALDPSSISLRCIHSSFNCEQWHKRREHEQFTLQWQELEHDNMAIVAVVVAPIQSFTITIVYAAKHSTQSQQQQQWYP